MNTNTVVDELSVQGRAAGLVVNAATNKIFYIPCGRDGTLAVIAESRDGSLSLQPSVVTAVGAHTGALDPKTGRLYIPAADYHLTLTGIEPADGTFRILVLGFRP